MTASTRTLDQTFAALGDPTRIEIVIRLSRGSASVSELAEPFDLTLQTISKHIKVLERCGLISRSRHAQFRPCRLEPHSLDATADWIERNRQIWTERFDQLGKHLHDIQRTAPVKNAPNKKRTRS